MTAYDFQLVTVLVTDDYNEGIPVAWLISNKEATDALKIFFSSLRERCGEVQTETFMSDDTDAYYNTWVSTFSRPDRKLLCSWQVDRSWVVLGVSSGLKGCRRFDWQAASSN